MNTIYHMQIPAQFSDLRDFLNGRITRKAAHNTQIVDLGDQIVCEFHGLAIVRYTAESIMIDNCGYETSTTRDRFNHLTPCRVYQEKYRQWIVIADRVRKLDLSPYHICGIESGTIGNWLTLIDGKCDRLYRTATFGWPSEVSRYKFVKTGLPSPKDYGWLDAQGLPLPDREAEAEKPEAEKPEA